MDLATTTLATAQSTVFLWWLMLILSWFIVAIPLAWIIHLVVKPFSKLKNL